MGSVCRDRELVDDGSLSCVCVYVCVRSLSVCLIVDRKKLNGRFAYHHQADVTVMIIASQHRVRVVGERSTVSKKRDRIHDDTKKGRIEWDPILTEGKPAAGRTGIHGHLRFVPGNEG